MARLHWHTLSIAFAQRFSLQRAVPVSVWVYLLSAHMLLPACVCVPSRMGWNGLVNRESSCPPSKMSLSRPLSFSLSLSLSLSASAPSLHRVITLFSASTSPHCDRHPRCPCFTHILFCSALCHGNPPNNFYGVSPGSNMAHNFPSL